MPKLPYIDRIWRARGSIELIPPRTSQSAFARLDGLLDDGGTSHEVHGDTLHYVKDNPAAQDKLATFSRGTLRVEDSAGRARLHYELTSPAQPNPKGNVLALHPGEGDTTAASTASLGSLKDMQRATLPAGQIPVWPALLAICAVALAMERILAAFGGAKWR